MKACTGCKETKPLSDFFRDKRHPTKYMPRCKSCKAQYFRNWKKRNPGFDRRRYLENKPHEQERHLIRKYGVTLVRYQEMLDDQNGKCAICGKPEPIHKKLDVDHDHATGEVRGLLCTSCNRVLGHAHDSVDRLLAAVDYLSSRRSRKRSEG